MSKIKHTFQTSSILKIAFLSYPTIHKYELWDVSKLNKMRQKQNILYRWCHYQFYVGVYRGHAFLYYINYKQHFKIRLCQRFIFLREIRSENLKIIMFLQMTLTIKFSQLVYSQIIVLYQKLHAWKIIVIF